MYRNPEDSIFRREQAKELFLFSDKTQKEISKATGVSDRTVREWIKRFHWDELKYRINHPPATFIEGIRIELTNLQNHILAKDCGFPDKEEVNTMHRLILCLQKLTKLPQHDHTVQTNIDSEADSLASPSLTGFPQGNERSSGEGLPISSAFVDNSHPILPPSTENQSSKELPSSSKSGSIMEVSGTEAANKGVISTASEPERSAEQTDNSLASPSLTGRVGEGLLDSAEQTGNSLAPPSLTGFPQGNERSSGEGLSDRRSGVEVLLPNGLTWVGSGKVLDPVSGKPREIKMGELDQLSRMGFSMRSLDW